MEKSERIVLLKIQVGKEYELLDAEILAILQGLQEARESDRPISLTLYEGLKSVWELREKAAKNLNSVYQAYPDKV